MTTNGNAIEVQDLSFAYGDIQAVDGVSFAVAPGEILGFLGPNGAGKSTTIKMLTGQLLPDSGSISVLGMSMPEQTLEIQARIGVCFEEKNLYENMSARENLDFFARLYGIKGMDFDPYLRRVGLIDRADDRVGSYSKGMRQRLMMTRAMINSPDILFLDEPTDGLDPVSSQSVRNVIKAEAERGASVILTTHDMHEADQLSDRVAFINEGKIEALDTAENLKLEHGQRSVRIRSRDGGGVDEKVIGLDEANAGDQIRHAVSVDGLMTIHTEEATLEDIFIKLTGRELKA
jgi:ABC-2 type transport system ATP-binding protein